MLISVVVPAYKQENTIVKDLTQILEVMSSTRFDFELIVIVDGFLDNTYELAKNIKDEHIKVYGYKTNRGKGYAVRYGMARAQGDLIAFIDAGMEIDPNGISMCIEHMLWYDADIIVGSKRHPASKVTYTPARKLYSLLYSLLIRVLFRLKVRDTQAGLKIYKREVLEAALPRLVIKEYAFDVELLAVSKYLGFRKIYEAPIKVSLDFETGGKLSSSFLFLSAQVRHILLDTLAVFYRMYFLRYYHNSSKRKWVYDEELDMRINTGGLV